MGEPSVAHLDWLEGNSETLGERKHLTIVPAMRTQEHPNVRTLFRNHITFDYIQCPRSSIARGRRYDASGASLRHLMVAGARTVG